MTVVGQNLADRLAGALHVKPGAPMPYSLQSTRQDWAGRLGPEQPVTALPGLMASLFSLCGHSHRLCSQLAIDAARQDERSLQQESVAHHLRMETAQEHIRRLGLDWPRLLGWGAGQGDVAAQAVLSLRACPLFTPQLTVMEPWSALCDWLHDELLKMAPRTWLRAWQACGADWLHDWCLRYDSWLSRLVRFAREVDLPKILDQGRSLPVPVSIEESQALTDALALNPNYSLYPLWRGACAHTGNWTRLNRDGDLPLTVWSLLGSRVAELIRLSLPDEPGQSGTCWLSWGCRAIGTRQGLAWVEMARGLLVYRVEIDAGRSNETSQVVACQVIAPTEWNFHPRGEVAQRLADLESRTPAEDMVRRVHLLMAAFDPCVPFKISGESLAPAQATGGEHQYA